MFSGRFSPYLTADWEKVHREFWGVLKSQKPKNGDVGWIKRTTFVLFNQTVQGGFNLILQNLFFLCSYWPGFRVKKVSMNKINVLAAITSFVWKSTATCKQLFCFIAVLQFSFCSGWKPRVPQR